MSFSDAIGQIDQIVQWEQQLSDPAVLTQAQTSAAAGATAATSATGSSAGASFAQALAQAQAAGAVATTDTTNPADSRVEAMLNEANALVGKPYVWGGGHGGWGPQSGYDCSGFVSAVLHAGGYLSTPQDTTTLPATTGIDTGPGQHVTIYDRDKPGGSGHVIIAINGQFYESGGEQGSWGGGGGVQRIATPSASYLATFDRVLHPAGL
jgi:cell wall-associated NlpC family hydrolase